MLLFFSFSCGAGWKESIRDGVESEGGTEGNISVLFQPPHAERERPFKVSPWFQTRRRRRACLPPTPHDTPPPPSPPTPSNGARDVARLASPRLASLRAPDVLPRSYFSQGICFGRGSLRGCAESDVEAVGQLEWLRRRRRH